MIIIHFCTSSRVPNQFSHTKCSKHKENLYTHRDYVTKTFQILTVYIFKKLKGCKIWWIKGALNCWLWGYNGQFVTSFLYYTCPKGTLSQMRYKYKRCWGFILSNLVKFLRVEKLISVTWLPSKWSYLMSRNDVQFERT